MRGAPIETDAEGEVAAADVAMETEEAAAEAEAAEGVPAKKRRCDDSIAPP